MMDNQPATQQPSTAPAASPADTQASTTPPTSQEEEFFDATPPMPSLTHPPASTLAPTMNQPSASRLAPPAASVDASSATTRPSYAEAAAASVAAIPLPPFYTHDPRLWFIQLLYGMVIMSTNDVNIVAEDQTESSSEASWFILDETGDTLLDTVPAQISVSNSSSSSLEEGEIDSKDELSTTFEDAKEVLSTVETPALKLSTFEDSEEGFFSTLENKEVVSPENKEVVSSTIQINAQEMKRGQPLRSVPLNITPQSTPRNKKAAKKRKRKAITPVSLQKNATPRIGSGRGRNKSKKRKKSVILIDSESEPEPSVIEIDDESQSIIILSDDEVGVCTGTVTKPRATKQDKAKKPENPIVVEDLTGGYIPKNGESSKGVATPEKTKKSADLYQPVVNQSETRTGLRPIVIDGCNVAFGHGRDRFSSLGLKICVDYFKNLGHEVHVFIPQFRKHHNATTDPQLLDQMEKDGTLSYTPSRRADGKMIVSYDDRFIVEYADVSGGVIVSKDNYRDLLNENPEWKETINKRLLMYTWVGDTIMFPKDPLGRHGPSLQEFLKF